MAQPHVPSLEDQHEADRRSQEHSAAINAGSQQAAALDQTELRSKQFLDDFTDLDIERSDLPKDHPLRHGLMAFLGADGSKQIGLGFIDEETADEERIMDRARSRLARMEYAKPADVGSECTGETRRRLTGDETDEYRELSPDLDRQIAGAYETVSMFRSGSVNGQRARLIGEITVNARNESLDAGSSGGLMSRATSFLRGE